VDLTLFPTGLSGVNLAQQAVLDPAQTIAAPADEKQVSFMEYLAAALNGAEQLQTEASLSAINLVTGNESFLHNTMIAYDRASMALQLTVEVRNRIVESYQEIMRMQM
jgi:flagellar hook-basal body complex protein FliE